MTKLRAGLRAAERFKARPLDRPDPVLLPYAPLQSAMYKGPRGVYVQAAAAASTIDESTSPNLVRPRNARGRGTGTATSCGEGHECHG